MKRNWNIEELKKLRNEKKTLKQIGELFGVSLQRIAKLIGKSKIIKYPKGYKKCYGNCKKILSNKDFYKNCKRCKKCTKENTYPYIKKYYKEYLHIYDITK